MLGFDIDAGVAKFDASSLLGSDNIDEDDASEASSASDSLLPSASDDLRGVEEEEWACLFNAWAGFQAKAAAAVLGGKETNANEGAAWDDDDDNDDIIAGQWTVEIKDFQKHKK